MSNHFLRYLSKETVLPLRISSIPSRISSISFGSETTSRVSFMLSNLFFGTVMVSGILDNMASITIKIYRKYRVFSEVQEIAKQFLSTFRKRKLIPATFSATTPSNTRSIAMNESCMLIKGPTSTLEVLRNYK